MKTKVCTNCGKRKKLDQFYWHKSHNIPTSSCKVCIRIKGQEYREKNQDKIRESVKRTIQKYPERVRERYRRRHAQDRQLVLDHYGRKCRCCGESREEFLCVDHIKGGGNAHRKTIHCRFYLWLRLNKYPAGFRTLCHNCNVARSIYGICPHKREKVK